MDHLAATPVAPIIAAADPEARKKIGASVVERLQCYADNDGVTYAEETYVLTAQAGDHRHIRLGTEREPATRNLAGYGIALARPSGRPRKSAASQRQPSVRVAQYPKARYRGEDSEQLASERCSYQCRNLCRRSCVPMWRVMASPPYMGDASEQSASACCASLTSPGASFKVSARWSVCLHSSHCLSWWYASPK